MKYQFQFDINFLEFPLIYIFMLFILETRLHFIRNSNLYGDSKNAITGERNIFKFFSLDLKFDIFVVFCISAKRDFKVNR